jgi:hypothetical protein
MTRNHNLLLRIAICFIVAATGTFAFAVVPPEPTGAIFLGQLQPTGLPAGIPYGGGGNSFERRVDLSGSLGVVSAGVFRQGADQGYAFVYDFSNPSSIQQIATLRASDHSPGDEYGDGVAISGHYVFVTAWGDSQDRGAVYMYDVADPQHITERKITAFDAAPENDFGFSLAVDGNRLIVGAPKFSSAATQTAAAYIVDFSDPNHIQQHKIVSATNADYGEAVALSGNYAIVGQSSDSTAFPFAGSAHLYDISNLNSIVEKRLAPTDGPNYTQFGERVAINGTTALVSVSSDPGPTNNAGTFDGTVWAFDISDLNQITQTEFGRPAPQFGGPEPPFGRFLDLQNGVAVAGAFNEDGTRGAAYFWDVSDVLAPKELFRLPSHSTSDSRFGISFALDGNKVLVSDQANHVYLYQLVVPEPVTAYLMAALTCCLASCRHRRAGIAH